MKLELSMSLSAQQARKLASSEQKHTASNKHTTSKLSDKLLAGKTEEVRSWQDQRESRAGKTRGSQELARQRRSGAGKTEEVRSWRDQEVESRSQQQGTPAAIRLSVVYYPPC
jgi:hypothetical protein